MIIRTCQICGENFAAGYRNDLICQELLCRKINLLRSQKRSAENRLAPLETELAERNAASESETA